ncbi:MAG: hypothetical protein GX957_02555 [Clostridiaceae bacterium]|nr:hypothetical protein [Clostridiaceae bacterium]
MHNLIATPYIPVSSVNKLLIAGNAPENILNSLILRGIEPVRTTSLSTLPRNLSYHPDMQFVNIAKGIMVCAKGVSADIVKYLNNLGFEIIFGYSFGGEKYPFDIAYNCAVVGKVAFLNLKYTDAKVIEMLKKFDITPVHIPQGYAKCSIAIVNQEAIITADTKIYENAVQNGIDALIIPPQKNIVLEGYDYGFIGGSSGLISETEMAFTGDFNTLDSADLIRKFLDKKGVVPVSLGNCRIADIGSLIPLTSV